MRSRGVFRTLEQFFSQYKDKPAAAVLAAEFRNALLPVSGGLNRESFQLARHLYEQALFLVEKDAVDNRFDEAVIELQRGLYRELEGILESSGYERRHHFIIVVPVADRPLMFKNFLGSLIEQCGIFVYRGTRSPVAEKVTVFVIDDSKDPSSRSRIREIAAETATSGLPVHYVGQKEQSGIFNKIPSDFRKRLSGLIGDFQHDVPGHKGASVTRNIAYLYLRSRMDEFPENTLIWFIDSDEEFRVKVKCGEEIRDIPFINYFYWLDRIFMSSEVEVLTGKVVGDPPVTPAVMINTFLEDIFSFLQDVSAALPGGPCVFHGNRSSASFSAEYHDMTGLFGYQRQTSPKEYNCSLTGSHTVGECLDDFFGRATGFFSGLHPTRTQFYVHDRNFLKTEQARTVYTGNYLIRRSGIRHFLPFAGLGLRMAGPTLGRMLRKRLGQRFVSANLPLLHKRTLPERFTDEFRSGIDKAGEALDLSGEFIRQFWGDVMLFSVEDLTEEGYPEQQIDKDEIAATVTKTEIRMWELYQHHQTEVGWKISGIRRLLEDQTRWWNLKPETKASTRNFLGFCAVVEENFGPQSAALKKISDQIEDGGMKRKIICEIGSFQEEERLWDEVLGILSE